MTEIPDDILKAAEGVADEFSFRDGIERDEGVNFIARAILAERNRCTEAARFWLQKEIERNACPDGWKLVPIEPTQEMLDAVTAADQSEPFSDKTMKGVFVEMLAAAPSPSPLLSGEPFKTGRGE